MNSTDIIPLLSGCMAGSPQAVTEFFETFHPAVFRMALSILDDPDEADEAAQDALLKALKNLETFKGPGKFVNWLYTITLNVCRNRMRKQRARQRLLQVLTLGFRIGGEPVPEEQVIRSESQAAVWRAIQGLPEKLRLVVILRYYHELPIAEIAEILGASQRTVHNRLHAAHQGLQLTLEQRR